LALRVTNRHLPKVPQFGNPSEDSEQRVIVDEDPEVLVEESQEINGNFDVCGDRVVESMEEGE
jgi:hypothetical protein